VIFIWNYWQQRWVFISDADVSNIEQARNYIHGILKTEHHWNEPIMVIKK